MIDTSKLVPLEDVMLDDAEQSLIAQPKNGLLDQIVANDLRRVGVSEADILMFFGYHVSAASECKALVPSTP